MVNAISLKIPGPHFNQSIFTDWSEKYPHAQALIAPCGTKAGKSFGAALWLFIEAVSNPGFFCVWLAPTYLKCKIGYRYIKSFCPPTTDFDPVDGKLEIRLSNGSFIKFLHGRDAEITVEGEAVDRFVIDEAGKQSKQLWYSLFTTITQTGGKGIITGTPRGFTWYYDEFRKAKLGDPFYCWASLKTEDSPFVKKEAIEQAQRLLPKGLFEQYYLAQFVSESTVFGDIGRMFDTSLQVNPLAKFWIHPNEDFRKVDTVTGWDMAKLRDYSVFFTVNLQGQLVGYARFRKVPYELQVDRLKYYLHNYFQGDRILRYDATGVGNAVGEMIVERDIDASITAVTFSQKSKMEMVNKTTIAIENDWFKCPRIEQIEHEFGSYEVTVTKSGLFSYAAPDGDHDDCVSAGLLAISGAYQSAVADNAEKMLEDLMNGPKNQEDNITEAASVLSGESEDDFFDYETNEEETLDDFSFDA